MLTKIDNKIFIDKNLKGTLNFLNFIQFFQKDKISFQHSLHLVKFDILRMMVSNFIFIL